MTWLVHLVQIALIRWGYLALAVGLLEESAGRYPKHKMSFFLMSGSRDKEREAAPLDAAFRPTHSYFAAATGLNDLSGYAGC